MFSGSPRDWVRYLALDRRDRYVPDLGGVVHLDSSRGTCQVEPFGGESEWFCSLLTTGVAHLQLLASRKAHVHEALQTLLFSQARLRPPHVRLSRNLPTDTTREMGRRGTDEQVNVVFNRDLAFAVRSALNSVELSHDECLGMSWQLVSSLVVHLAFPRDPRDRYLAKIEAVAKLSFVALNVLYESEHRGQLVASECGDAVEQLASATLNVPCSAVQDREPYLRMLRRLAFALRAKPFHSYAREFHIAAREFLDSKYIRLSLSGAMPEPESWKLAMPLELGRGQRTPPPEVGRFGILNLEDLEAWERLSKAFHELGFTLVRQLGLGEFGRVYEAYNRSNADYPERVALKVDKILGKKKRAILEADLAMQVGRELAGAPHLIRLYDTGKVHGRRFTYHVLQLVDGGTLNSLVGSLEVEHQSIQGPPQRRFSVADIRREFARRVGLARPEVPERHFPNLPFRHGLSPAMLLDLLTSILLCLEEVHALGYAMNDLKNDNMMMSRRGQLKGIDLDSFSKVRSPIDKSIDFLFLAASLVLVVLHAPSPRAFSRVTDWHQLIQNEGQLTAAIGAAWSADVVESLSEGRVSQAQLVEVLRSLIVRSRSLQYASDPALFASDIDRLVEMKRRLLLEDLVID